LVIDPDNENALKNKDEDLREKIPDLTLLYSDTSSELAGNPAYTL